MRLLGGSRLVRQVVGSKAHMVRVWVAVELHRCDVVVAFAHGPGHPMPSIHDRTIRGQDDRKRQIRVVDQCHVLDDSAPGDGSFFAMPDFVELADATERNLFAGQVMREPH